MAGEQLNQSAQKTHYIAAEIRTAYTVHTISTVSN